MGKNANTVTISPTSMGLGAPVVFDAIRATIEQLNWSYINRPTVHFSWCASGGDTGSPSLCPISFSETPDVEEERLRTVIFVNMDTQSLLAGIRVEMASGALCTINLQVGATTTTFDFTDADVDERTVSLSTDDTAKNGFIAVILTTTSTSGSTGTCKLLSVRVQDELIVLDACAVTDDAVVVTDDGETVTDCGDED